MAETDVSPFTRLHITPLNPSLLETYLPSSLLPQARDISYHTIQTFPDRNYGYITLPTMDADKIKKKLNGSILKGTKVRIENARPEKEKISAEEGEAVDKVKRDKGVKRKRGLDEIEAVQIGDRSVKRGWTVPGATVARAGKGESKKDSKVKVVNKSKYTTAPECLFKTVLPPNVASKGFKSSEGKPAKPPRREGSNPKGKEAVVHEFSKTTKYATFLKSSVGGSGKKPVTEFVKGKGWVDEDGNVVEAVKSGKRPDENSAPKRSTRVTTGQGNANGVPDTDSSSSDSSSESSSEDDEALEPVGPAAIYEVENSSDSSSSSSDDEEVAEEKTSVPGKAINSVPSASPKTKVDSSSDISSDTDSSTSSSEPDAESDSSSEAETTPTKVTKSAPSNSRPASSTGPPPGLSITIPPPPVHPLEALYKRPKPTNSSSSTAATSKPSNSAPAFSFFGADDEDNEDIDHDVQGSEPQVPLTPFTQRDVEWRGLRSAAPTPDTAFANKRFIWPTDDDDDNHDEDNIESTPVGKGKGKEAVKQGRLGDEEKKGGEGGEESEFQKWFYEHRGDANRAWKKRRREVAKEKRQRENRRRGERG